MKKIVSIIIMALGFNIAYSQSIELSVVASSGNYFQGTNATLSWTLGEPAIETYSNGNNILTQGFQQSKYIINAIEEFSNDFIINVYPNPITNYLIIECENPHKDLVINIFNMIGKNVIHQTMKDNETVIMLDMSQLSVANYFLVILDQDGKLLKTFKLLKINN